MNKITEKQLRDMIKDLEAEEINTFPSFFTKYGMIDSQEKLAELIEIDPVWKQAFIDYGDEAKKG